MTIRLPLASIAPLLICACFPIVSSAQNPTGGQELASPPAAPTVSRFESGVLSDNSVLDEGPMASFARMLPGQWQVTFLSGTSMFNTWNWGPGEHSMRVQTAGSGGYHETLLEATGTGGLEPLNELDYFRSQTLATLGPRTDVESPKPFTGDALHVQSAFEWVPYADYVYARSVALDADGEPTHLLDAYIYHHAAADALRCLALPKAGGVYEGELTVLEGGALQLELKGYDPAQEEGRATQAVQYVMRFDFEKDGALRDRVWSPEGTLVFDVHHRKVEPKKN